MLSNCGLGGMKPNSSLICRVPLALHPTYPTQLITTCSIKRGFGTRFEASKISKANTIALSVVSQHGSGFVFIALLNGGIANKKKFGIDLTTAT
jgi:hypothetical protein